MSTYNMYKMARGVGGEGMGGRVGVGIGGGRGISTLVVRVGL